MVFFVYWCHSVGLFLFSYSLGIYLGWESAGMLGCWASMEVCTMALVSVLSGTSVQESDGAMVYFIFQVFGSIMIFLGSVFINGSISVFSDSVGAVLMCLGVFMKLGVFPFLFWVPRCLSSLSWFSCFMISVPQKFLPLWIMGNMSVVSLISGWVELVACVTACTVTVMSVGVKDLRILFSYSSIIHSCFMMVMAVCNFQYVLFYLSCYALISLGFSFTMSWFDVYFVSCVTKMGSKEKMALGLGFASYAFSFAGLPPFLGFSLKVAFIQASVSSFPVAAVVLTILSVISLYFYYDIFMACSLGVWSGSVSFSQTFKSEEFKVAVLGGVVINVFSGLLLFLLVGFF